MTQRERSQSIGMVMTFIFSAVFLWALTAVVWPVPVVYADDPEIIMITVTSSLEIYFYDPGLDPTGGTVYFNSVGGEGAGQVLTVTTTVAGSMPITLTGATAFGMMPIPDTNSIGELGINYTIGINADTESGVLFTVTDPDGLTDTAVITFTQDNVTPIVEFTDVTDPGYDYDPDWSEPLDELDTDGSNWYDPDNLSAGWYFTSTATDTLSGLALADASWDHSKDTYDQLTYNPGLDGDGAFNGVSDDGDGVVTVTLTITDNVGNPSVSDTVIFNLDNTEPITTSAYISEASDYLYTDTLTIYYSNGMGSSAQDFAVYGQSDDGDDGVGLGSVDFSLAFGETPHNRGTLRDWCGVYHVTCFDTDSGTITVTVSDLLGNLAYQTFDYIWDTEPPTVTVSCPSVTFEPSFLVSWDGSDPSPGSSVKHYDVQFSEVSSDGPWQNWYVNTPLTQATFGPTFPITVTKYHTYYFRVRAEDNVSNDGPYTNGEDATTYLPAEEVFLPIIMVPDPNWDFETGDFTSWQHGGELAQTVQSDVVYQGNYAALLGSPYYNCEGGVPVGSAWIQRTVTVPSTGSPVLSFWYLIKTHDHIKWIDGSLGDSFDVYVEDSRILRDGYNNYPNPSPGCGSLQDLGWRYFSYDLSSYRGQNIQVRFENWNRHDGWYNTWTYLDAVQITN